MIELKDFDTEQELFDFVVDHFKKQGERATVPVMFYHGTEGSAYRTGNLSCAIGCLIADEDYNADFEGKWIDGLVRAGWVKMPKHFDLMTLLQDAHDNRESMEAMYARFLELAVQRDFDCSHLP